MDRKWSPILLIECSHTEMESDQSGVFRHFRQQSASTRDRRTVTELQLHVDFAGIYKCRCKPLYYRFEVNHSIGYKNKHCYFYRFVFSGYFFKQSEKCRLRLTVKLKVSILQLLYAIKFLSMFVRYTTTLTCMIEYH